MAWETMGDKATKPVSIQWIVVPQWKSSVHPSATLLQEYASRGCPVSVGQYWTVAEIEAAIARGPHVSALKGDAIAQIQVEAREKEAQGFSTIYKWDDLKSREDFPSNLNISSLAMIPHKIRKYREILDLSFLLQLAGYMLPSVNDATERYAPNAEIDQIMTCIPQIITSLAAAP